MQLQPRRPKLLQTSFINAVNHRYRQVQAKGLVQRREDSEAAGVRRKDAGNQHDHGGTRSTEVAPREGEAGPAERVRGTMRRSDAVGSDGVHGQALEEGVTGMKPADTQVGKLSLMMDRTFVNRDQALNRCMSVDLVFWV